MGISADSLKAVSFIGIRRDGGFQPRATGFFVTWKQFGKSFPYFVTAEHVISRASELQQDIYVRANRTFGSPVELAIKATDFLYHPDNATEAADIAVALILDADPLDAVAFPLNGPLGMACSDEVSGRQMPGLGDATYIIGLFSYHGGKERNLPIVRVGSLAAFSAEPIMSGMGREIRGHLIEARSTGGLSGSPVLMELADLHKPSRLYVLGLIHGHFPTSSIENDGSLDVEALKVGINTGIGIVIPVEKILETLVQPKAEAERREVAERFEDDGFVGFMNDLEAPGDQ